MPSTLIPVLVDLYITGKFPFDKLVEVYDLKDINKAAEDSEKGITLKLSLECSQKIFLLQVDATD